MEQKKKICKRCTNPNYIKGHGLCDTCYSIEYGQFSKEKVFGTTDAKTFAQYITGRKPIYKEEISKLTHGMIIEALHKKLWKLTSKYVRLRDAVDGECGCYTCTVWDLWTNMDAGHFIHKSSGSSVYYEHKFIKPQCKVCNQGKDGQPKIFKKKLLLEFGQEEIDALIYRAKQTKHWTEEELQAMIKEINSLLNKL